jgi:hypothetical protein
MERAFLDELGFLAVSGLRSFDQISELGSRWIEVDDRMDRALPSNKFDPLLRMRNEIQAEIARQIEAFLSFSSRASMILWPNPRRHQYRLRGRRLRDILDITTAFPRGGHPLHQRTLRNIWTHFDERLEVAFSDHAHVYPIRFARSDEASRWNALASSFSRHSSIPRFLGAGPVAKRTRILREVVVDTLDVYYLGTHFPLSVLDRGLEDVLERLENVLP